MLQLGNSGIYRDASQIKKISVIRPIGDVVAIILLVLAVLWLEYLAPVHQTGFWCDSDQISKPLQRSTISKFLVYVIYGCIAGFLTFATETLLVYQEERTTNPYKAPGYSTFYICGTHVHRLIIRLWHYFSVFVFGALSTVALTDILKCAIGELRPNFLATCQPDVSTCQSSNRLNPVYVSDSDCKANGSSLALRNARQSMPSTYAAWAFYSVVWTIVYLHCRLVRRMRSGRGGGILLVTLLQLTLLCSAILISLTRVTDSENHWYDVVVGGGIGSTIALVFALCIAEVQWRTSITSSRLATSSVLAPPPPPEVATGFTGYGTTTRHSVPTPHTSSTSGRFSQDDYYYHNNASAVPFK